MGASVRSLLDKLSVLFLSREYATDVGLDCQVPEVLGLDTRRGVDEIDMAELLVRPVVGHSVLISWRSILWFAFWRHSANLYGGVPGSRSYVSGIRLSL